MGTQTASLVFPGELMGLFDFFKRAPASKVGSPKLKTTWTTEGVCIEFARALPEPTADGLLEALHEAGPEDSVLGAYLVQLASENRCSIDRQGALVRWHDVYELRELAEHVGALQFEEAPRCCERVGWA
jgi:hypothetical protein